MTTISRERESKLLGRILWVLCSINILVCMLSFSLQMIAPEDGEKDLESKLMFRLHRFFGVNVESSFATWYNGSLWFCVAVASVVIAFLGRDDRVLRRGGMFLALVAAAASLDEIAQVHESMAILGQWVMGSTQESMPIYAHFLWVVPGLVLSTLIGLSLLKFIRRLPAKAARGIIAGGVIFLAGALGMEILSGLWSFRYGENAYYQLWVTLEEGMEMTGISVALVSLLSVVRFQPQQKGVNMVLQ